jgi:hypothetical protein
VQQTFRGGTVEGADLKAAFLDYIAETDLPAGIPGS